MTSAPGHTQDDRIARPIPAILDQPQDADQIVPSGHPPRTGPTVLLLQPPLLMLRVLLIRQDAVDVMFPQQLVETPGDGVGDLGGEWEGFGGSEEGSASAYAKEVSNPVAHHRQVLLY
mmetsp:Transcript_53589/g.134854  ORF Transcript_53589/g.134854 Transcript_53589/m.134854 type:complete len:118 (-) Transcript_53589:190-543(-)